MATATIPSALAPAVDDLATAFSGDVLRPTDAGYDEARRIHNGMVDKHPTLIARCRGTADVVDAVEFARTHGLEISVRGGGHNVAGRAVTDGGLMIDLSPMKGIRVDAAQRVVDAQGGVTWNELNRETQLHGLATTGGVISTTGIAGLTLGGGIGWLFGMHGLSVDNLLSVELVTADGRVITASDAEHPDLFWAVRGGGGNFGVATSFRFRLHPVGPTVIGGLVAWPLEAGRDVLRHYREITRDVPDEMALFGGLVHAPDGSGVKLAAIFGGYFGDIKEGEKAVRPIKEFGTPAMDALGPMPYSALNAMLDAGFPKGALNYWKSSFLDELSDEAIDTMVELFERCPSPMSGMLLEHFHGAATRVPVTATAVPHRQVGKNFLALAQWMDPAETERNVAWAREAYAAMEPHRARRRYVNYMDEDDAGEVAQMYGPNYERLREVKRRYDPDNLFHLNQNIRPA